jgi:hypothetical protein
MLAGARNRGYIILSTRLRVRFTLRKSLKVDHARREINRPLLLRRS